MPGENLPRRVWNRQTKLTYNHWLAALVKGKCSSTKPTRLATARVVCHPDTEQNRPYKIPWPWRGLNRGPTAPQARTLPVCHTTPLLLSLIYNNNIYLNHLQIHVTHCTVTFMKTITVIKQNESEVSKNSIFIFLIDCIHHLQNYLLQLTP